MKFIRQNVFYNKSIKKCTVAGYKDIRLLRFYANDYEDL